MSKGTLLVIEPDFDIRKMLDIYFSGLGYEVECVSTGSEALASIRHKLPDMILLEVNLPEMSGYDIKRELLANKPITQVPLIFLAKKPERRINELADDFIFKPFDLEELKLRVKNAIAAAVKRDKHD